LIGWLYREEGHESGEEVEALVGVIDAELAEEDLTVEVG
jgi:hypothetical protein